MDGCIELLGRQVGSYKQTVGGCMDGWVNEKNLDVSTLNKTYTT